MVFTQKVVYTRGMRTLLLILLIFSGSAIAEDETQSFFDFLKGLGRSDCAAFLDNGDALINASNKAANEADWDAAFYYDDQAFHSYMKAFGHCDGEPENKTKAEERLEGSQLHGNQLACIYHITEAQSAYQRSTLALDHLNSASISLKHATDSLVILSGEAERFCAFDEDRSNMVLRMKSLVMETIDVLQAHIDEHGEDGIQVP